MSGSASERPRVRVGYCTNVHAGDCLDAVLANLETHGVAVRQRLAASKATAAWTEPMDVGLWLPVDAARQVRTENRATWLRDQLAERGMRAFTFNGFPYGDFHRKTVKKQVYRPGWDDPRRLAYTRDLVEIMACLHDAGEDASISTVPITWRDWMNEAAWARAVSHLRLSALHAAEVQRRTGVCVHIDLEPEPGCSLDRSIDVVRLFEDRLLPGLSATDEATVRHHIRVCHDSCHAAVMFDGQGASMDRLAAAGIGIGKIQVSSAIDVDFGRLDADGRAAALERLRGFAEPRYLHQVMIRTRHDGPVRFITDLPEALADAQTRTEELAGERWRVHFHVPVHVERIEPLGTTQFAIDECLEAAARHGVRDLEVETYAWTVLPEAMRPVNLADGIAAELAWVLGRPGIERLAETVGRPEKPGAATRSALTPTPGRAAAMAKIRTAPVEMDLGVEAPPVTMVEPPNSGSGSGTGTGAGSDDSAKTERTEG